VYNYYPYGQRIPLQAGLSVRQAFPYRFTGQRNEMALGLNLYHFEARLNDPALGRWLQVDPMAAKYAGMSSHNYAGGNPVNITDPDGRFLPCTRERIARG